MRFWRYVEPSGLDNEPHYCTLSEAEIIQSFYGYWARQMRKAGKAAQISREACIEDWVVVHWAWRVTHRDSPILHVDNP